MSEVTGMELICAVQNYHWGKKGQSSLVGRFASANSGTQTDDTKAYAEFWMGTHPNGPSRFKSTDVQLSDHLSRHPDQLGLQVIETFGLQLPFLFKILSVAEPLSIQAHPTKAHAEELFHRFPEIYKDPNHKPELAIALTHFEALCGFRPLAEIKHFLRNVPEFKMLIDSEKIDDFLEMSQEDAEESCRLMKDCFQNLMLCETEKVASALEKLLERCGQLAALEQEEFLVPLVKRIHSSFPKDVGVFCVYWFNHLILGPGEAVYLAPNEPHAYLHGDCLECMANSDNVVRAGLTPKFRDIKTLCEMLSCKNYHPSQIIFHPTKEDEYSDVYSPPVKDFSVVKVSLPKKVKYTLRKRRSGSIVVIIEGKGKLNSSELEFGKVFFVPAMAECTVESESLVLYQAFCNV